MSFAWEDWEHLDGYDKTKLVPLEGKPKISGWYDKTEYIMKQTVQVKHRFGRLLNKDIYTLVGVTNISKDTGKEMYRIVKPKFNNGNLVADVEADVRKDEVTLYIKPRTLEPRLERRHSIGGKKSRKHIKSRKNKKSRKLR